MISKKSESLIQKRTLNISNALVKNLLQGLWVLKLSVDLGNDRLGKLALLTLFNLSLITDPGVKNLLSLMGQSSSLIKLESLGLKLSGFLF
jgi:hypothetical protein